MVATVVFVLGLDIGVARAALGSVVAEIAGLAGGLAIALRLAAGFKFDRRVVLDRARLTRMLAVNRDVTLVANSVLHNFTLIGSFFLDGLATAAQQLCGQAMGAGDRSDFERAARMVILWGLGFSVATSAIFLSDGAAVTIFTTRKF
jgi:multidrug resistance protein, MATE family